MGGDKYDQAVTEVPAQHGKWITDLEAVLPDLEHYVSTHGPGPDVRLAAFKEALATTKAQLHDIYKCLKVDVGLNMAPEETLAGGVRNLAQAYVVTKEIKDKHVGAGADL